MNGFAVHGRRPCDLALKRPVLRCAHAAFTVSDILL